jgi:hypothetical protein
VRRYRQANRIERRKAHNLPDHVALCVAGRHRDGRFGERSCFDAESYPDNPDAELIAYHVYFVRQWLYFLIYRDVDKMSNALQAFAYLSGLEYHNRYLSDLLKAEGESDEKISEAVSEAKETLGDHVLRSCIDFAMELFAARQYSEFKRCIQSIKASGFESNQLTAMLRKVITPYVETESAVVADIANSITQAEAKDVVLLCRELDPNPVFPLYELSTEFADFPEASEWNESSLSILDVIARANWDYGDELFVAGASSDESARRIALAQSLPKCEDTFEAIRIGLETQEVRRRQHLIDLTDRPEPVKKAPTQGTIYGFGLRLYGSNRLLSDPDRYYSTLYFTIAFLPIFPVARYVMRNGDDGSTYFQSKVKFTKYHKVHLVVGLGLLILWWILGPMSHDSSTSTPTASTAAATDTTSPSDPNESKHDKMVDQSNQMAAELQAGYDAEATEKASIDKGKAELKQKQDYLDFQRLSIDVRRGGLSKASPQQLKQFDEDVISFNQTLKSADSLAKASNARVDAYNARLDALDAKKKKYDALIQQINSDQGTGN